MGLAFVLLFSPLSLRAIVTEGEPAVINASIDEAVQKNDKSAATVRALERLLDAPDSAVLVKERAAWGLGKLGNKKSIPSLLKGAQHKGLLVRKAAVNALVNLRAPEAVPALIAVANNDPVVSVRQDAVLGLGLIRAAAGAQTVADLSRDERTEIRGAAALSMGALHSKKADFSALLKGLSADTDPYVQDRANAALAVIAKKSKAVREQLSSPNSDVRLFAAQFFQYHGAKADLPSLNAALSAEQEDDVRDQLTRAVAAVKKRVKAAELKAKKAAEAKRKAAAEAAKKKAAATPKP
jgi:HEAT repeat protein